MFYILIHLGLIVGLLFKPHTCFMSYPAIMTLDIGIIWHYDTLRPICVWKCLSTVERPISYTNDYFLILKFLNGTFCFQNTHSSNHIMVRVHQIRKQSFLLSHPDQHYDLFYEDEHILRICCWKHKCINCTIAMGCFYLFHKMTVHALQILDRALNWIHGWEIFSCQYRSVWHLVCMFTYFCSNKYVSNT